VREAWNEGPPAPSTDHLLANLRPMLREIDRERSAQSPLARALESLRGWLSVNVRPAPIALAAAGAFALALAVLPRPQHAAIDTGATVGPVEPAPQIPTMLGGNGSFQPVSDGADVGTTVYELAPQRLPAILMQSPDGSTTLWLIDEDNLSLRLGARDGWG